MPLSKLEIQNSTAKMGGGGVKIENSRSLDLFEPNFVRLICRLLGYYKWQHQPPKMEGEGQK